VTVGRLEPVKGHINLINAWKLLNSRGLRAELDIFGEGTLRAELEDKVRSEGLGSLIRFRGFSQNIAKEFSNALFNVLVSATEGFPNVVIEAAATGTATLLTDVDGSRDTIHGPSVLPNKLAFGHVTQLVGALSTWFRSPTEVVSEGLRFESFLRELCSAEAVTRRYEVIYESLLVGKKIGDLTSADTGITLRRQ
jgi:glycosyltransferase involved in cell wall biosynthesis